MSKVAKYILSHKLGAKEVDASECRILEVSLPAKVSVDIEFTNITMTVSEGFSSRSKYLSPHSAPVLWEVSTPQGSVLF